jgi:hypothetical protein
MNSVHFFFLYVTVTNMVTGKNRDYIAEICYVARIFYCSNVPLIAFNPLTTYEDIVQ